MGKIIILLVLVALFSLVLGFILCALVAVERIRVLKEENQTLSNDYSSYIKVLQKELYSIEVEIEDSREYLEDALDYIKELEKDLYAAEQEIKELKESYQCKSYQEE